MPPCTNDTLEVTLAALKTSGLPSSAIKAGVRAAVQCQLGLPDTSCGLPCESTFIHDMEEIKREARAILGLTKKDAFRDIFGTLRNCGFHDLAAEFSAFNKGRRAVAHKSGSLKTRVLGCPAIERGFASSNTASTR